MLISCSDNHLGNRVYVQHMYDAIDTGSSFGACIFVGDKKGGYTVFKEILIYSEVISFYQESNLVYIKQKFNVDDFNSLIIQKLEYRESGKSYIPDEIYELVKKDLLNKGSIEVIESSDYVKKRIDNGLFNYYVLNIQDYSVKSFFKESDFRTYLNKNQISNVFKKL